MLWLLPGLQMQPVSQALTFQDDAKSAAVNQILALLTCLYLGVMNPANKPFVPGNAGGGGGVGDSPALPCAC